MIRVSIPLHSRNEVRPAMKRAEPSVGRAAPGHGMDTRITSPFGLRSGYDEASMAAPITEVAAGVLRPPESRHGEASIFVAIDEVAA